MANITVYRDPAGIKPEVNLISGEVNLAEWMLANVVMAQNYTAKYC